MARLDATRSRVLCDDFGLCNTELAVIDERKEGRILFIRWGWMRDVDRVWRYSARRASRTPPERLTGLPHAEGWWVAPQLGPFPPQYMACPAKVCADRAPQLIDCDELDVLPMHGIKGVAET